MSDKISINRDLNFNDMVKDFNENLVKVMDLHTHWSSLKPSLTGSEYHGSHQKLNAPKQRLRRRDKAWRCYKTDDSWTAYKVVSAEYRNVKRRVKCDIISKKVLDHGLDTQNFMHW